MITTGPADFNVMKRQPWRRQQPGVDLARDTHLNAEQPAGLDFEQRAMAAPIDQQRTHQRRQQRQDDRDRQCQQSILQRQLPRWTVRAGRALPPNTVKCTPFLPLFGGNSVSGN